jgi:hypothetical protein
VGEAFGVFALMIVGSAGQGNKDRGLPCNSPISQSPYNFKIAA